MVKSISAQSLDISRRAWQWFLPEDDTTVRSSAYALALERQEDTSSSDGRNHFPLPQLGFHPPDLIQVDSLSGFVLVVMKWGQSVRLDGGNLCEIPSFAVSSHLPPRVHKCRSLLREGQESCHLEVSCEIQALRVTALPGWQGWRQWERLMGIMYPFKRLLCW